MRNRRKKSNTIATPKKKTTKVLLYNGIEFKSTLEIRCYKSLEKAGLIPAFSYEPKSYVIVDSFNYTEDCWEKTNNSSFQKKTNSIRNISYTPDFVSIGCIIETKGRATDVFTMRWKLFKKHLVDTNTALPLFIPSNQQEIDECIKIILERKLY